MIDTSKPVTVIDASYLLFYRYFATKRWLSFQDKDNVDDTELVPIFEKHLRDQLGKFLKKSSSPKQNVFICKDAPRESLWRMEIWPQYKEGRAENKIPRVVFEAFWRVIEDVGTVLGVDRLEADDIAALLVQRVLSAYPDQQIIILTSDHDYLQLARTPNIQIWNAMGKDLLKSSVGSPEHDLWMKVILGDKSDNIPAAFVGCGMKRAEAFACNAELRDQEILKRGCQVAIDRNLALIDLARIPDIYCKEFERKFECV